VAARDREQTKSVVAGSRAASHARTLPRRGDGHPRPDDTESLAGKVAMQPATEQGAAGASPSRATRPHREIPTTMMMMWAKTKRTKTSLTDRRSVCEPDEN